MSPMLYPRKGPRRLLAIAACACLALAPRAAAQEPATDVVADSLAGAPPLLSLEEAVELALANNQAIRIARNQAAIAENDHSLGNAGFLPSLGVTAQQNRFPGGGFGGGTGAGGGSGLGGRTTVDLSTSLSYTLFDGFQRFATYRRLGVLEDRAGIGAEATTENTLARLATGYYDLVRQQQQLETLRESIEISEERLKIAQLRLEVGSASELEVRRAQVDRNADLAALLRQEAAFAAGRAALGELLGLERGSDFRVESSIPVDASLRREVLTQAALGGNRELRIAERGREAARLERREIRGEWFPTVALQLGYNMAGLSDGLGFRPAQPEGWTYGLSVRLGVFDGLNRERRLQNARLRQQSAELEIGQARTQALAGLEAAYTSYQNALQLTDLEEENVLLARQNVDVALERFRLGLSTSVELREVQSALTSARTRLLVARWEAKAAEIELLRLSGRLLGEMDGVE